MFVLSLMSRAHSSIFAAFLLGLFSNLQVFSSILYANHL